MKPNYFSLLSILILFGSCIKPQEEPYVIIPMNEESQPLYFPYSEGSYRVYIDSTNSSVIDSIFCVRALSSIDTGTDRKIRTAWKYVFLHNGMNLSYLDIKYTNYYTYSSTLIFALLGSAPSCRLPLVTEGPTGEMGIQSLILDSLVVQNKRYTNVLQLNCIYDSHSYLYFAKGQGLIKMTGKDDRGNRKVLELLRSSD